MAQEALLSTWGFIPVRANSPASESLPAVRAHRPGNVASPLSFVQLVSVAHATFTETLGSKVRGACRCGQGAESQGLSAFVAKLHTDAVALMMWHGGADVIATYKICTVRAGDSSSSSRDGVEAGHRPTRALLPSDEAECEAKPAAQPDTQRFCAVCRLLFFIGASCSTVRGSVQPLCPLPPWCLSIPSFT